MLDKTAEARPGTIENLQNVSVTLRYVAPLGHMLEDCLRKDYWKNLTRECSQQRIPGRHAWNRVEIIAEDGSWEAELRILAVGPDHVEMRLLREWRQPAEKAARKAKSDGYKVEMVPGNGWRAVGPKNFVIAEKLLTEAEAQKAAEDHAARMKGDD